MRKVSLAISGILSLVLIYLSITNLQPITLAGLGSPVQVDLGVLPIIGLALGAWAGAAAMQLRTAKIEGQEIKQEWQIQDAKLAASVRSDREKQLEAKIATLEAALKAALKK